MSVSKYLPLGPVVLLYAILGVIGWTVPGLWQPVALLAFYAALGQAFNIFLGMTGYVDFGYVAFLAMGSYGMALVVSGMSETAWLGAGIIVLGLLLGVALAAALSTIVGAVALRLRGAYFAIATIGVNEGFRYLLQGTNLWGGTEGIIISGDLRNLFGRETANALSTLWADGLVFLIALVAALVTLRIIRGKAGYALTALREDEEAARVMGIYTTKYKIIAFITSAAFAGLIGATAWTLKLTYVFPSDVFAIIYTIEAIVIVMLGGAGTLLGPLVGGIIYGLLKYSLSVLFPGLQLLVLAPIILVIIVAFPQGIVGVFRERIRHTALARVIL